MKNINHQLIEELRQHAEKIRKTCLVIYTLSEEPNDKIIEYIRESNYNKPTIWGGSFTTEEFKTYIHTRMLQGPHSAFLWHFHLGVYNNVVMSAQSAEVYVNDPKLWNLCPIDETGMGAWW